MRVYESQALDPHVNREKFREELFDKEMNNIQKKEEEEKEMNPSLMTNELLSVYFLIGTFLYYLSLYNSLRDSFIKRDLKNISYPLNCSLISQCIHRLQFSSTLCRY